MGIIKDTFWEWTFNKIENENLSFPWELDSNAEININDIMERRFEIVVSEGNSNSNSNTINKNS